MFKMRGVKASSVIDGNYLLDGGCERLILKWKVMMGMLMDRRDGVPIQPLNNDFHDLLERAGSATYEPKYIAGMELHEFINLSGKLAPIESDGPGDEDEWNLFDNYLVRKFTNLEDLDDPRSLGDMVMAWEADKVGEVSNI